MGLNRKQRRATVGDLVGELELAEKALREKFQTEMNIGMHNVINTTMTVTAYALHDSFGWGHDRIERLLKRVDDIGDDVMSGTRSLEDCKKLLLEECKINIV